MFIWDEQLYNLTVLVPVVCECNMANGFCGEVGQTMVNLVSVFADGIVFK